MSTFDVRARVREVVADCVTPKLVSDMADEVIGDHEMSELEVAAIKGLIRTDMAGATTLNGIAVPKMISVGLRGGPARMYVQIRSATLGQLDRWLEDRTRRLRNQKRRNDKTTKNVEAVRACVPFKARPSRKLGEFFQF